MGTPDFALFSLRALIEAGEDVVGVITQPDKPKGRGYELQPPPVKVYAKAQGIPVYQPTTLRDGAFATELEALAPDVYVKGGDYTEDSLDPGERAALKKSGSRIVFISFVPGHSSTGIIRKMHP